MSQEAVIDALFCLPKKNRVAQPSDCVPYNEDLAPALQANGLQGVVIGPGQCLHCQHQWSCTDRRNQDVVQTVGRNRRQLCGLASYDSFRIGESLRWIDEAVGSGQLAGAYVLAESCVAGLDAARMYPLYGICAKLNAPVVLDFSSRERWLHHRTQVEVIAADFPQQPLLLSTPLGTDSGDLLRLMQRYPCVGVLLTPSELQNSAALCEYLDGVGRERVLFRAAPGAWGASVAMAHKIPLAEGARRGYLYENAARLFQFPAPRTA